MQPYLPWRNLGSRFSSALLFTGNIISLERTSQQRLKNKAPLRLYGISRLQIQHTNNDIQFTKITYWTVATTFLSSVPRSSPFMVPRLFVKAPPINFRHDVTTRAQTQDIWLSLLRATRNHTTITAVQKYPSSSKFQIMRTSPSQYLKRVSYPSLPSSWSRYTKPAQTKPPFICFLP